MLNEVTQAAVLRMAELLEAADGTRPLAYDHFLEERDNIIYGGPLMQVFEQQGMVSGDEIERKWKKIEIEMWEGHYYNLLFPALFPSGVKWQPLRCLLCAKEDDLIEMVLHLNEEHQLTMVDTAAALRLALEPEVAAG